MDVREKLSSKKRLIDANALYDRLEVRYKNSSGAAHKAYGLAIDDVCDAPTVEARPVVHGQWECGDPYCPVCGKNKFAGLDADIWADWQPDYCPNCGADMREVK